VDPNLEPWPYSAALKKVVLGRNATSKIQTLETLSELEIPKGITHAMQSLSLNQVTV